MTGRRGRLPRAAVLVVLALLATTARSARADDSEDARLSSRENPFACLGGYQALTGSGRTLGEIEDELRALLGRIEDGSATLPAHERAVDLCVAAKLKARLGESDAADYFARAIAAAPREPGYELFAGQYWGGMRGARRPLLERAEDHLYAGLAKLEALRARKQTQGFHDTVDDWLHKQLLVLYQQDGAQILPWKAYHQGPSGRHAPGLSFSSQLRAAQDTRDFFYNSEMRQLTGEANFAASDLRAGNKFTARDAWDLVRAPRRYEVQNRLRLRHNYLGALDFLHSYAYSPQSQVRSFYDPTGEKMDVTVVQLGAGYEKTFSLYPLFDFRLAGAFKQGTRKGVLEFEPDKAERFRQIEVRPSVSRFVGADVLTLDLAYVALDFADPAAGPVDQRLRRRDIRAVRLEYARYSPLLLPSFASGSLGWERTAIRGWSFFAGAVDDRELWGLSTVVDRDLFLGTRFGGAGRLDVTLQGTWSDSSIQKLNPNQTPARLGSEPGFDHASARGTLVTQIRLIDQDGVPGVPPSHLGFGVDMLNLVFPLQVEHALTGRRDYQNLRVGSELWIKLFGTGVGGAAVLLTMGYDFQYFYEIQKAMHLGQVALRLGWGEI